MNISDDGSISYEVYSFKKTATRLPEATWFSFNPSLPAFSNSSWMISKIDGVIDSGKIVFNGSMHLHATKGEVSRGGDAFRVTALDSPLVSVGRPDPFPIPLYIPANQNGGVHFCLHNNIWGTKYVHNHVINSYTVRAEL
jgi:hypothetical protein